jgi:penicillin-binding protein 1C
LDEQPRRLHAGCAGHTAAKAQTYARWPALLESWVENDWRSEVERLPFANTYNQRDSPHSAQRSLSITGIEPGSVLRPSPGRGELTVQVRAIGSKEAVTWLLNGRTVGSNDPGQPGLKLKLTATGPQALTALDAQGRYERVEFRVQ